MLAVVVYLLVECRKMRWSVSRRLMVLLCSSQSGVVAVVVDVVTEGVKASIDNVRKAAMAAVARDHNN